MSLVKLEIASDDLLRGAMRALPLAPLAPLAVYVFFVADPATASLGDLIAFYRSNAALWIGVSAAFIGGLWEMVFLGPSRRAAVIAEARHRAVANRAPQGYWRGRWHDANSRDAG